MNEELQSRPSFFIPVILILEIYTKERIRNVDKDLYQDFIDKNYL